MASEALPTVAISPRKRDPALAARLRGDLAFRVLVIALSLLATVPLALILIFIIVRGASSISWQFLTELPKPMGESGGGIANAPKNFRDGIGS